MKHRSWMFVPGDQDRFLRKVTGLDVDAVLLDLEDGVLPQAKEQARRGVSHYLSTAPAHPVPLVRVNALGTAEFESDLSASVGARGICLPKVESATQVIEVDAYLTQLEHETGAPAGATVVVTAIESAVGLLEASHIAGASPRVVALLFGAEDFALDMGMPAHRTGVGADLLHARSTICVAARAAGKVAVDGVYPVLRDDSGLRAYARQSRELGFTGMATFHPDQAMIINETFSAAPAEVAHARRVVDAFDRARESGVGAIALDGELIDLPIVLRARSLLTGFQTPTE